VLVLHDFDVAGFSIFGTLGSDGRRYRFQNKVPLLDIGLRLEDVEALELLAEPVETSGSWQARAETLEEHGATDEEIDFLRHRRVELNAMTAPVFVAFLEEKLALHGIKKVIPNARTVELHTRRVMEQVRAEKALQEVLKKIRQEAAVASLPPGLLERLKKELTSTPEIPWDRAVADIVRQDCATQ
jgi:Asp-tRNA(Asn)/Glu-tRNA(Gln) amidotransferase A subunit family amidase